jgi:DNA-binding transcriptional ArsR family regulator
MSLPAVVQHIDVLRRSGLVTSKKVGRVRTCRLEPTPMRIVEGWVGEHRATWERQFDRLGDVLEATYGEPG